MAILILNKRPLKNTPYHRWLPDAKSDTILFSSLDNQSTADMEEAGQNYSEACFLPDYDTGALEASVWALHARRPIHLIIALSEVDLMRAAKLREALGISGMSVESAWVFRDKYRMKSTLSDAGIATASMARIRTASDLLSFVRDQGLPVVVKPRSMAGAMGVTVVRTHDELNQLLKGASFTSYGVDTGLIVEKFVPGDIYHIDGIAQGRSVLFSWPSVYTHGILDFLKGLTPCGSLMLGMENPLHSRLQEFTASCVAQLPFPDEATAFHAEAFVDDSGRITLCEIAARPGGGGVTDLIRTAFPIDLNEIATRGQAGQLPKVPSPAMPDRLATLILFPKKTGTLERIPASCELDYVTSYSTHARVGAVLTECSRNSVDKVATALLIAPNEATLRQRTQSLIEWFNRETKWS